MARSGRKRKQGVERYPGGQIKPDTIEPPHNMAGVVTWTSRDEGNRSVTRHLRRSEILSRWLGPEIITPAMFRDGERCGHICRQYRTLVLDAKPLHAKTAAAERNFAHEPDITEEEVERAIKICSAYRDMERALRDGGRGVLRATLDACMNLCERDVALAVKGLGVLGPHFGR